MKTKMEFELWDIFEDLTDESIDENIKYILKREKIWKDGMSIVFPCGALSIRNYEDGFYQQDFEIFAPNDFQTILYYGTAYGKFIPETNQIMDMTIELKPNIKEVVKQ